MLFYECKSMTPHKYIHICRYNSVIKMYTFTDYRIVNLFQEKFNSFCFLFKTKKKTLNIYSIKIFIIEFIFSF